MTITYDPLDLIIQGPPDMGPHCTGNPRLQPRPPAPGTSLYRNPSPHLSPAPYDMGPCCTRTIPGHIHAVLKLGPHCTVSPQTYSNLFIMHHARLASGRFASYWNAFLYYMLLNNGFLRFARSLTYDELFYMAVLFKRFL